MEFWFRRTYRLPPTDPRYLDATPDDIATEYWAYRFHENPNTQVAVDDDFDLEKIEAEWAAEDAAADAALVTAPPAPPPGEVPADPEDWEPIE